MLGARGRAEAGAVRCALQCGFVLFAAVQVSPAWAQRDSAKSAAIDASHAVAAEDLRATIEVLARDSMRGKLGGRELEARANYVAKRFEELGLVPAGAPLNTVRAIMGVQPADTAPSWLMFYALPGNRTPNFAGTTLAFTLKLQRGGQNIITADGQPAELSVPVSFGSGARFASDTVPESGGNAWGRSQPYLLVLAGHHTPATVRAAKIREVVVLYVPPADADSAARQAVLDALKSTTNVVILDDADSVTFARKRAANEAAPPVVLDRQYEVAMGVNHWTAYVWPGAIRKVLEVAKFDVERARAESAPAISKVPMLSVAVYIDAYGARRDSSTSMNVIGILPGTDSMLRNDYIVVTAHMDEVTDSGNARSSNGANDNASGVAGLISLAKAFSQPEARPKRSLMFVASTGMKYGSAGMHILAQYGFGLDISVPIGITLDAVGGAGPKDSLFVDGLHDAELTPQLAWVAARHADLGVTLAEGGSIATAEGDPVAFVGRSISALHFYGQRHKAPGPPTGAAIDADLAARRLRMVYYIAREIADGRSWPRWTPEGRAQRIAVFGR